MKKTKLICTIGPSSGSRQVIQELIQSGMDAARLNFSHGDYSSHLDYIKIIREEEKQFNKSITLIQDLQGPKIRVGAIENGEVEINNDDYIFITSDDITGSRNRFSTSYKNFCKDVKEDECILIDDGLLMLKVEDKIETKQGEYELICKIIKGGMLKQRKGINLPHTVISLPSLTEKDLNDLDFGLKSGVDIIALSFVRKKEDLTELRKLIRQKGYNIPIISKIERPEAIKDIDSIISESDAVMVARGDLGVELSPEEVPLLQKLIITKCNEQLKPVITATQMLESMVNNRIPTRAEASDVANAILDGTDCVMLSAETSTGIDPVNAAKTIVKIIEKTELIMKPRFQFKTDKEEENALAVLCNCATEIAEKMKIETIITITNTGKSPLFLSSHRVAADIYALTANDIINKFNNIIWGVKPLKYDKKMLRDDIINFFKKQIQKENEDNLTAVFIYNKSDGDNESADTISVIDIKSLF